MPEPLKLLVRSRARDLLSSLSLPAFYFFASELGEVDPTHAREYLAIEDIPGADLLA